MEMLVLVARASKHGATEEITERIAQALTLTGQQVEVRPVQQAGALGGYDGFVVGARERFANPDDGNSRRHD
jgi:menaquinone-dependent protoporphyrinogen oxidase